MKIRGETTFQFWTFFTLFFRKRIVKGWHDIFNTKICLQLTFTSQNCWQHISNAIVYFNIGIFSNPAPEGHTGTLKLTFIPQGLAWYIQYQNMFSTDIYSPNCWQHISNAIIYLNIGIFPKPSNSHSSTKIFSGAQFVAKKIFGAQFATNKFSGAQFATTKIFRGPICRKKLLGAQFA